MRKKFSKFICVFTVIIVTLFSFTFSVSAVEPTVYTIQYQKPSVDEYSGYIEVLSNNGYVHVTTWNVTVNTTIASSVSNNFPLNVIPEITIRQSSASEFYFDCDFSGYGSSHYFYTYTTSWFQSLNGNNGCGYKSGAFSTQENHAFSYYFASISGGIKAVRVYGNARLKLLSDFNNSSDNWSVTYGNDTALYYKLQGIKEALQSSNQSVIDNANQNASEIQENQDKNTDKVLNGDSDLDSSGETGKVDGALGDIDGATNNAMGGKNEAQVKAEINNALDPDKIGLDFSKANRLSVFFDDTLSAFGSSYKSLLLLSLSLGLGAFLIGRRYG